MRLKTTLVTLLIPLLFAIPVSAQAGDEVGIIVSPPYFTEEIVNGAEISQEFRIINQRPDAETFTVFSKEVEVGPEGEVYIKDGYDPTGPSRFEQEGILSFTPQEFFLQRGESQIVTVELNIPDDTPTSALYLELAISVLPKSTDEEVGVMPEVAIPILVNNVGEQGIERTLEISSFAHDFWPSWLYEYTPIGFHTTIANTGNQHIQPTGEIFVSQDPEFKEVLANFSFSDSNIGNIISGSTKSFYTEWNESLLQYDNGGLEINTDKPLAFGHYYAQLNLIWDGTGESKQFATMVTDFWIIPWKLILVVMAFVIFDIFTLRWIFKRRVEQQNGRR